MSKSEWGEKRECPECGARFYDLKRSPIICPKCDTQIVVVVEKAPAPKDKPTPKASTSKAEGVQEPKATEGDDKVHDLPDIEIDDADDTDGEADDLIDDADDADDDMSGVLNGAIDETKAAE